MFIFLQSSISRPFSMMIFLYYLNFMTFTILMTPKSLMRLTYTFQSVMSNYFLDISTWMSSGHLRFRRSKVCVWSPYPSQSSACEIAGWVTEAKPGITLNISLLLTPFQSTYQIWLLHPRNILETHLLFSLSIVTTEMQATMFSHGLTASISLPITNFHGSGILSQKITTA